MTGHKAAVAIFVYNRRDSAYNLLQSIQSLKACDNRDYYIFSDGGKNLLDWVKVQEVRTIIKKFVDLKAKVFERDRNLGLANSVISGVSLILEKHESVIVLEDDLALSEDFFIYMDRCLEIHRNQSEILAICGYSWRFSVTQGDTYTSERFNSWGWAIWADRWSSIEWDLADVKLREVRRDVKKAGSDIFAMVKAQKRNKIDSWAVRMVLFQSRNKLVSVHPKISRSTNLGLNNSGTHSKYSLRYKSELNTSQSAQLQPFSTVRPSLFNQICLRLLHSYPLRLVDYLYNWCKQLLQHTGYSK
jgi:hypothetical protein